MDTWIEVLNEKSLFETEIDHKQWGDFTTWQVLIFYQEVYLCHQIGHLHKRNLIVHTQSLVLSEGQSSVVLGLLGFKMESETLLFIQGVNVYLKSLTLLNLDDEIDLWNWNCTWGYGAFGIPYGKKIEDTDFRGADIERVEFAPLRMILVELNILS